MTPTILDHANVVALFVVTPVEGVFALRKLRAAVAAGDPRARSVVYARTMLQQWGATLMVIALWLAKGRAWDALGASLPGGWPAVVGAAFVMAMACLMWQQYRTVKQLSDDRLRKVQQRSASTFVILPVTPHEHRLFFALAITAGICEEVLCRGYVVWHLGHWIGPWWAMVASSLLFGLAHMYQGREGIVKTGVVGVMLGSIYLLSGSLLWPILAHAIIDIGAGFMSTWLTRPVAPLAAAAPAPA